MATYIFNLDNSVAWRAHLEEQGFVVIANLLSDAEISHAVKLFESHLQQDFPALSFSDERSLSRHWPEDDNGFISDDAIPHSRFMWFCRTHENVLRVFSEIYGTKDLVTCFDRANAVRNLPKSTGDDAWPHVDFPVFDEEPPFECFQSFLNLVDCTAPDSPCLRVAPQSHFDADVFEWIRQNYEESDEAFFMVPERPMLPLLVPAGSLVLWNSRVVHDGRTNLKSKLRGFGPLRRLVAYLSYAPKQYIRDEAERQLRQSIYEHGSASTHWPAWRVREERRPKRKRNDELEKEFPVIKRLIV